MSDAASEAAAGQGEEIDASIARMERLFRSVTGREAPPPDSGHAPIPVERDPGEYVEEQMDRLLSLLGETRPSPGRAPGPGPEVPAWTPLVTVWETEAEIVVQADLPGVSREEIQVTAHGNAITIAGQRPAPTPPGEGSLRLRESAAGPFRRTLVLASAARGAEPAARMHDGVLEIRVAREGSQVAAPRSVPVN